VPVSSDSLNAVLSCNLSVFSLFAEEMEALMVIRGMGARFKLVGVGQWLGEVMPVLEFLHATRSFPLSSG